MLRPEPERRPFHLITKALSYVTADDAVVTVESEDY